MTQCRTSRLLNALISLANWPTRSHSTLSATDSISGDVSSRNATATMRGTPWRRASRAISSGSSRLPAMMPSDWMSEVTTGRTGYGLGTISQPQCELALGQARQLGVERAAAKRKTAPK